MRLSQKGMGVTTFLPLLVSAITLGVSTAIAVGVLVVRVGVDGFFADLIDLTDGLFMVGVFVMGAFLIDGLFVMGLFLTPTTGAGSVF